MVITLISTILIFMSNLKFMLRRDQHEKSLITLEPGFCRFILNDKLGIELQCFLGEPGGLVVEPRSRDTYLRHVVSLSKDTFTHRKVLLLISRKRWLRPDMTEKVFTGTLSLNKQCFLKVKST